MLQIFQMLRRELEQSNPVQLVTIIRQAGSSPRGLGAQMLVGANGRIFGSVGGGAVERRSEELAVQLLAQARSSEAFFSLKKGSENDIGMVCGGDVALWFQYIDPAQPAWLELVDALLAALSRHEGGWLALRTDGALPALLNAQGQPLAGSLPGGTSLPAPGRCLQTFTQFFLPLEVRQRAVIFGGGHCAQALVPVLHHVGFRVTVVENRPEYATPALFPEAEAVVCGDYTRISDCLSLSPEDYVVVMTNGHSHDLDVQLQVLQNPPVYVGVIGSRSKKAFVNAHLLAAGLSQAVIDRVHSPIGTDIKAVTPEEIAISIAGEMILERARLREKTAPPSHACPMHE